MSRKAYTPLHFVPCYGDNSNGAAAYSFVGTD